MEWKFRRGVARQIHLTSALSGPLPDRWHPGMSPLARHRAVYAALGGMMDSDIHALVIRARVPDPG